MRGNPLRLVVASRRPMDSLVRSVLALALVVDLPRARICHCSLSLQAPLVNGENCRLLCHSNNKPSNVTAPACHQNGRSQTHQALKGMHRSTSSPPLSPPPTSAQRPSVTCTDPGDPYCSSTLGGKHAAMIISQGRATDPVPGE